MIIGVFGNSFNSDADIFVQEFIELLENAGCQLYIYEPFFRFAKNKIKFRNIPDTFKSNSDIYNKINILFSIGGDGTLLETLRIVRDSGIPTTGINLGRLGFLATISKEGIKIGARS